MPGDSDAAALDGPAVDGAVDGALDAASDGAVAAAPDGLTPDGPASDGPAVDGGGDAGLDGGGGGDGGGGDGGGGDGGGCAISAGHSPALDGVGDLADYPSGQRLIPGATLSGTDEVAVTWDPTYLYVTVTSDGFLDPFKPLHVYLEASTALGAATPSTGKEYSALTPALPFTPTHLIAVRRQDDSGMGGPYDGVYGPGGAQPWTDRVTPLVPGTDVFVSADLRTLSVRTPWSALGGCPLELRLDAHLVNAVTANEWKDLVPTTHTPWLAPGGGYYQIDLTGDPAVSGWSLP